MSAMASKKAAHRNEAAGFPFWQSRLGVQLGVAEELIREARASLVEGVDWCLRGQRVLFSAKGVERLKERLGLERTESKGLRTEWGAEGAPQRVKEFRVVRLPVNGQLVLCVPLDDQGMPVEGARAVRVRVRSNVNFLPGMVVKARAGAFGEGGVYVLVGTCPRWRGRF